MSVYVLGSAPYVTPIMLFHLDVKKFGRIPEGGGWRAHGGSEQVRGNGIGYDYVHVAIDDYTRVGYAEVLPDENGATTAGFLTRATPPRFTRPSQTSEQSTAPSSPAAPGTTAKPNASTGPGKPNGPTGRSSPAATTRQAALAPWLEHYNTERIHTGIGTTPITRVSPP